MLDLPMRIATSGHELRCSTCSFTIPEATPYYRTVNGEAYCQNCGIDHDPTGRLMQDWKTAQVNKLAEARKSERRLAMRERRNWKYMRREWTEVLDTEG